MTTKEMAKAYNALLAAITKAMGALEDPSYTDEQAADEAYRFLEVGLDAADAILNKGNIRLV